MSGRKLTITCTTEESTIWHEGALDRVLDHGEVHLWFASVGDHQHKLRELTEVLNEEERKRAARFVFEKDRDRFVVGHAMLRKVLGYYTASDPTTLQFERGRFGKPFLTDHPVIQFNFSDTKDAILIGVSVAPGLGVDLETYARRVDHAAVSNNYFTKEEQERIRAVGGDARKLFLTYWTRKEAILKASGVGIMEDLHSLRVDEHRNELEIHHGAFQEMAARRYDLRSLKIGAVGEAIHAPRPDVPQVGDRSHHVASVALPDRIHKILLCGVMPDH